MAKEVEPVRVLHVLTRAYRRGAEAFGLQLHQEFLARGVASRLVALAPAPSGHTPLDAPVLGSSPRAAGTLLALRRAARDADVVVAHGSDTLLACRLALLGSAVPFAYVNIGDPLHWAGSSSRRLRVRWMLRGAAAVGAISPTAVDRLVQHLDVSPARVRFTGNGRSSEVFAPASAAERHAARVELRLSEHAPVAVIVGALAPEKRVDIAVAAMGTLPGWHLLVVGAGPLEAALRRQASQLAPGRVTFTGGVEDVRAALHASDVAVLCSITEGLPGALIEAAMSGLPAAASDVGFVRDIVDDGVTGRLFQDGDIVAVAAALEECLSHRDRWGGRARDNAMASFENRLVVDRWLALLSDVTPSAHSL